MGAEQRRGPVADSSLIEASARALIECKGYTLEACDPIELEDAAHQAEAAIAAYLDGLLRDLPEQAVEEAAKAIEGVGTHPYGHEYARYYGPDALAKFAVTAFLSALRERPSGLEGKGQ